MKKLVINLLSLTLIATAVGCGPSEGKESGNNDGKNDPVCKLAKSKSECDQLKKDQAKTEARQKVIGDIGKNSAVAALKKAAVENYAEVVYASYEDTVTAAKALKAAVDTLATKAKTNGTGVVTESDLTTLLKAAQDVWVKARPPYLQTEAYRFYDGPINSPNTNYNDNLEIEPLVNAWPMDENYLDYTCKQNNDDAHNVAHKSTHLKCYPGESGVKAIDDEQYNKSIIGNSNIQIDEPTLRGLNEGSHQDGDGAEEAISTGWHAIEFLLWGQDFNFEGPGLRDGKDYCIAPQCTGGEANAERRLAVLTTLTDMMVKDLTYLQEQWKPGANNYRKTFVDDTNIDNSFHKILNAMKSLSINETGGERLKPALDDHDQEQEHSCFSDTTHQDFIYDIQGLINVWKGTYQRWDVSTGAFKSPIDTVGDANKGIVKVVESYEKEEKDYDAQQTDDSKKLFQKYTTTPPSAALTDLLNKALDQSKTLLDSSSEGGKSFDRILLEKYMDGTSEVDNSMNLKRLSDLYDSMSGMGIPYTNLFGELSLEIPADE